MENNEKAEPRTISELIFNISSAIIPYSKMIKTSEVSDIYSGEEKISFHKRNHEYITILIQEFAMS
ncbi:MAG: hypothetical protein ACW98X_20945 [Promethearchaeota archaeon]|jgi:hypothetical protein